MPGEEHLSHNSDRKVVVPQEITDDFKEFWERWRGKAYSVSMQLPDFTDQDWGKQYRSNWFAKNSRTDQKSGVTGEVVQVPYIKFEDPTKNAIPVIRDLVETAKIKGYGIIVDVGCSDSLAPLAAAAHNERSIVIAVDPYISPFDSYPEESQDSAWGWFEEYPYAAKWLVDHPIKNSVAFHFPLDIRDEALQKALEGAAWRVQIIAPNTDKTAQVRDMIVSSSKLVGPGGEMIVCGDGILGNAWLLGRIVNPESYQPDTDLYKTVNKLRESFDGVHEYDSLRGPDLFRLYGIGFSNVIPTVGDPKQFQVPHPQGAIVFNGKK